MILPAILIFFVIDSRFQKCNTSVLYSLMEKKNMSFHISAMENKQTNKSLLSPASCVVKTVALHLVTVVDISIAVVVRSTPRSVCC